MFTSIDDMILNSFARRSSFRQQRLSLDNNIYFLLCTGIKASGKYGDVIFLINKKANSLEIILESEDEYGFVEGMFFEPSTRKLMLNISVKSDDKDKVWEHTTLTILIKK